MTKYKSIYGPTGVVMLPSGKRGYNGLVEVDSEADKKFLDANVNFVKAETKPDEAGLGGLNISELKEYAELKEIDLGDATKKADIIAAIKAAESE